VYGPVKCLLVQTDQLCPDENCPPLENDGWRCNDEHGMNLALVGMPPGFFTSGKLNTGKSVLCLSKARKKRGQFRNEIIVDPTSKITVEAVENQTVQNGVGIMLRGQPQQTGEDNTELRGSRKLLMVYVTSRDSSPTYNFATVCDDIFGTGSDEVNVVSKPADKRERKLALARACLTLMYNDVYTQVSQYKACSRNKFRFIKASNRGDGVIDGAVQITIPYNTIGVSRNTVETYVDDYIEDNGYDWLEAFDHIMYVLPAGTEFFGALAYADSTFKKTVYNDMAASSITTQMHEIGHNLGMAHSGQGESVYGDKSCYMGKSFFFL
jgi:hypothetical protein